MIYNYFFFKLEAIMFYQNWLFFDYLEVYVRYYIIFGVTFILLLFILFYNPNSKYLGIYENQLTIEYDYDDEGYYWSFVGDNDNIYVETINNSKYILYPRQDGKFNIVFKYSNDLNKKYEIKYEFEIKDNRMYWLSGEGAGLLDYPNPY